MSLSDFAQISIVVAAAATPLPPHISHHAYPYALRIPDDDVRACACVLICIHAYVFICAYRMPE